MKDHIYESLFTRGEEVLRNGKLDAAIQYFRDAYKVNPSGFEACVQIGSILGRKGEYQEAMDWIEKAEVINRDSWQVNFMKAQVLFTMGRTDEALQYLEKAIRINPKAPEPIYRMLNALKEKEDYPAIVNLFRGRIQYHLLNPGFLRDYAAALLEVSDPNDQQIQHEIITLLERSYQQGHRDYGIIYGLGQAHYNLGNWQQAVSYLEKYSLYNTNHQLKSQLMFCYLQLNQIDKIRPIAMDLAAQGVQAGINILTSLDAVSSMSK